MSTLRGIMGLAHETAEQHPLKRQRTALEGTEDSYMGQSPSVESGVQLSRTLEHKIDHLSHMVQQLSRHGRHHGQSPALPRSARIGSTESDGSRTGRLTAQSPGDASAEEAKAAKAGFASSSFVIESGAKGYLNADQESEPCYAGNTHFAYISDELSVIRDYMRKLSEDVQTAASSKQEPLGKACTQSNGDRQAITDVSLHERRSRAEEDIHVPRTSEPIP